MNAKEAREIIKDDKLLFNFPRIAGIKTLEQICRAHGYLECLEGEEVKELVEAAQGVVRRPFDKALWEMVNDLEKALSKYYESIK